MNAGNGSIYLTFDDGPDEEWTPRVLDALAEARARATFFVVGEFVRRTPALLRRIAAEGHDIGNHTHNHRHPWIMSDRAAREAVRVGAEIIAETIGRLPRFYRAPHGRNRRCMTQEAEKLGACCIGWDLSAVDWGPFGTAPKIAARLNRAESGDILLMHDGRNRHNRPDELMRVLPGFLDDLATRKVSCHILGTEFVR